MGLGLGFAVHMNGRIYDPRLGRFLQADPIVQDLTYSQSLNRYSYGFNSPLSGTDPSGYWFDVFIAKVVFSTFINFIYSKVTESDAQPPDDAWKSQLPGNIIPGVVSGVFGASTSTSSVRTCIQGTSVCGGAPWQRSPGSHRQQVAAETMGDTYSEGTAGKFANGAATISYEFTVGYVQRAADPASLATSAAEVLVPGYDLYQCTQTRDCSGVVIAIGIVGIVPAGKLASIAGKGILGIARAAVRWQKAKRTQVAVERKGLGNPFRGKSAEQLDEMFRAKGFEPRGDNPVAGKGGFVNPKTGRSYHIDPKPKTYRSGTEHPHVDVNRPRGYEGNLDKRKFPLGDRLYD